MKFNIRDLLWLIVVAALACAWYCQWRVDLARYEMKQTEWQRSKQIEWQNQLQKSLARFAVLRDESYKKMTDANSHWIERLEEQRKRLSDENVMLKARLEKSPEQKASLDEN